MSGCGMDPMALEGAEKKRRVKTDWRKANQFQEVPSIIVR